MATENVWQGRVDAGEQGDTRRLHQIVQPLAVGAAAAAAPAGLAAGDAVLMGFACDAGVRRNHGRPGAQHAPDAVRRALASLPAHQLDQLWDAGDVTCEGDALEAAQASQGAKLARLLDAGARAVVLGGGHETAWADFQGLRDHLYGPGRPGGRLLIINFDAHFDLRTSRPGNSGTPFDQVLEDSRARDLPVAYACFGTARTGNTASLFAHARELNVFYVEDTQMREHHLEARLQDLDRLMQAADHVYLTIDLDVLPASTAPGVSAPNPYGVPLPMLEACVQHIRASGKLRLADLAEFTPDFDIDQHTARAAARLAWQLLQP